MDHSPSARPTPYSGEVLQAKQLPRAFNASKHKLYGIVAGEPRLHGACNFEIGGKPSVTEPRDDVRGDAARIWLYMTATYKIRLTTAQRDMFEAWSKSDPVDDKNPFVR